MEKERSSNKDQGKGLFSFMPRLLLCMVILPAFLGLASADDSPGLDQLMGGHGRADHQKRIEELVFGNGNIYGWEDFSAWGREIFLNGSAKNPPSGPSPSKPVSKFFKCITCHNYEREDPDLTVQDPEARFTLIEKTGKKIFLLQGATMWGVVNRKTFYSDHYSIYHYLCVPKGKELPSLPCGPFLRICGPGCRTMDSGSLEDATQVCSAYCSVGRYLVEWELYALLAFFWDQEIKLKDLDLSPDQAQRMKALLTSPSPDPQEAKKLRSLLASKYANKAGNTFRGIPKVTKDALRGPPIVEYEDGAKFEGDFGRGERLWRLSCGRCHGTEDIPQKAKHFTKDLQEFHKMLAKGTRHRHKPYMPNFSLERLTRQQAADILAYLKHLGK
jgi:mono/diheme cytochrome c family protein